MLKKFKVKFVGRGVPKDRPVLIVGQNPGRQRLFHRSGVVWEGNRSADLLLSALDGITENIILTNACNYQKITNFGLHEGLEDINDLITEYRPSRIICLGALAKHQLNKIYPTPVFYLEHPAYMIRFKNTELGDWVKELRTLITKELPRAEKTI